MFTSRTAFVLVTWLAVVGTAAAAPPGISVRESKVAATSEGEVVVDVTPDAAYAALADYGRWSAIFPSVASAQLRSGSGDTAVVEITSPKGKPYTLRFDNDRKRRIVRFSQRGGRVAGDTTLTFIAGPAAGQTTIHARLHAAVVGPASWFVGSARVRRKRQRALSENLVAIAAYLATPAGP